MKIRYLSPTWREPFRTVELEVQVPDGVETIRDSKIDATELVVIGDVNCRF